MSTAEGTQASVVRVWPSMVSRGLWVVGFLCGFAIALGAAVSGNLIYAPFGFLLVYLTARSIGWVEIHEGQLTNRHLTNGSQIVDFSDIREVGLGMHQVRSSKWWYPEIETLEGNSVKLLALKSYSGTETIARVEEIFSICMEYMPKEEEDQFRTVTATEVGDLELSPGYDAYLREQANSAEQEPVVTTTPTPVVAEQPTTQVPTSRRQPHLTLVDASETAEPDEEAPEVFTPQPLVDRRDKKKSKLTVVTDEFVERSADNRNASAATASEAEQSAKDLEDEQRAWQKAAIAMLASEKPSAKKLPAVVIEPPSASASTAADAAEEPVSQFTSLFRRSA